MIRSPVHEEQHQAALGPLEAQGDWRARLFFPLRGNVISVYSLDDPKNKAHVQFCDVQLWDGYPTVHRVWLSRPGFHQETRIAGPPGHRWRNTYRPWNENGTNGWAQSLLPGDLVLVQFVAGQWNQPFISHFWPASNQGRKNDDHPYGGGYPFNRQSRYRMTGGKIAEQITKRLDANADQSPQWTWAYNGAFLEILNDGSLLLQTSINRNAFIPEDQLEIGLKQSPKPEGNLTISTRGADQGDICVTTGKSDNTGYTNQRGNVLVMLYKPKQGNVIINAEKVTEEGNLIAQTSKEVDSQIFLRVKEDDDYINLDEKRAEVSHKKEVTLRSEMVSLGRRHAPKSAVTWEELTDVMTQLCAIFDGHVHSGVNEGEDDTLVPTTLQSPYFMATKTNFQSTVVKLELTHQNDAAAEPKVEIDRFGGQLP